jgi:hypothetical protein
VGKAQSWGLGWWRFDQGGNEGAEQRFASLAGVVDELEESYGHR